MNPDYSITDYGLYDLKTEFTLTEVSLAWSGYHKLTSANQPAASVVFAGLQKAIEAGELPAKIPIRQGKEIKYVSISEVPPGKKITKWGGCKISRIDLVEWCKEKNQKPKFLFPEAREQNNTGATNPVTTSTSLNQSKEKILEANFQDTKEREILYSIIGALMLWIIEHKSGQKFGTRSKPNRKQFIQELQRVLNSVGVQKKGLSQSRLYERLPQTLIDALDIEWDSDE